MATTTETRRIVVVADYQSKQTMGKVAKDLASVNKNVSALSGGFNKLQGALSGLAGYFAIGQIMGFADSMQLARNRLTSFTGSAEETASIMGMLKDSAAKVRAPIDSMAEALNRILISTKNLGLSYKSTIGLTETLSGAFLISGATTEESINATIQLTQALALGRFRMQEFNSVTSASPMLMEAFKKETKLSAGELRKFVEEGKFGSDLIVKAIQGMVDEVGSKLKTMPPTFQQTIVKAMNELKFKVDELNVTTGASIWFGKGVDILIKNFDSVALAIAGLAAVAIPSLIVQLGSLLSIPVWGWGAAAAVGIYALADAFEESEKRGKTFQERLSDLKKERDAAKMGTSVGVFTGMDVEVIDTTEKSVARLNEEINNTVLQMAAIATINDQIQKTNGEVLLSPVEAFKKAQIELQKALDKEKSPNAMREEALADLNKRTIELKYSTAQYLEELDKINNSRAWDKFREGKMDVFQLRQELMKTNSASYGDVFFQGAKNYTDGIKSMQSALADFTATTFQRMEDHLVTFVTKGKFEFAKFRDALLEDLTRVMIRSLMLNAITGIASYRGATTSTVQASNASGARTSNMAANGNAFNHGNIQAFASGGVVNSPTFFGMSSGRTGLMGEAGPEAIMPLARGSDGKLGVKSNTNPVIVNVINQSGAQATTSEREENGSKVIDILITQKTQEAFASGKMDKVMKSAYGLNRKGS